MGLGSSLPERHRRALRWFESHADELVAWPKPLEDGTLLVCKPKGIYKPKWTRYALSVRESWKGPYDDKPPVEASEGWLYEYFQEQKDPSKRDGQFTNRGLIQCQRDGVPVGVLRQVNPKPNPRYLVLGLGMVVGWEDGRFDIRGPVKI